MDQDRRKFLEIMLIGSGVLLTGKVLGPLYSWFFGDSSAENSARANSLEADSFNKIETGSGNFRMVRNNNGFSIYDSVGEEIFQIDEEA